VGELFDADPRERWTEALRLRVDPSWTAVAIRERYLWWPRFWFGCLNSWLVFLGPSPGNSPGVPVNWERDQFPSLGRPNEHLRTYRDSQGFWDRIRSWTCSAFAQSGVFGPEMSEAALAMTMVANVTDMSAGSARDVENSALLAGLPGTIRGLETVRPGLVVPMDKRLTPLIRQRLASDGWDTTESGVCEVAAFNQRYPFYRPHWYRLENSARSAVLIAEAPQHPSKVNFYRTSDMDSYLGSMITRAMHGSVVQNEL
jgi:hypothetical protein